MAFGQFNKLEISMEPLGDGSPVKDDEEIVQIMWDAVRTTHTTNMKKLCFENMGFTDSYKWADALKDYVCNRNL